MDEVAKAEALEQETIDNAIRLLSVFFVTVVVIAVVVMVVVIVRNCISKLGQRQTLKDIKKGKRKELGVAS